MTNEKDRAAPGGIVLIAALVLLGVWLLLHGWLAFRTNASEVEWARLFSLIGSIESIVFAAAGALFGTTIQRQRVEEAHRRADRAEEREQELTSKSETNAQLAANGRALASAVKAVGQHAAKSERTAGREVTDATDDLVVLAQKLFPE